MILKEIRGSYFISIVIRKIRYEYTYILIPPYIVLVNILTNKRNSEKSEKDTLCVM